MRNEKRNVSDPFGLEGSAEQGEWNAFGKSADDVAFALWRNG